MKTEQKIMTAAAGVAALGLARKASAQAFQRVTLYFNNNPGGNSVQIPGSGDIKVLNHALALEYLESSLYRQAIARLTTGGVSDTNVAFTGLGYTGPLLDYLNEFRQVEEDHSDFLRNAIQQAGGPAIGENDFAFDFGMENRSAVQVGTLVYLAELTGVSAYLGAIPFFTAPNSPYIPIAAAILGTEARHTAAVAAVLNAEFSTNIATAPLASDSQGRDTPAEPDQVLNQGFTVANSLTPSGVGSQLPPVSGPNGFVFVAP